MELSEELKHRGMIAEVNWVPRDANEEADALSRGVTEGFDESRRVHVDPAAVDWHVLPEALRWGEELKADIEAKRVADGPGGARGRRFGRKRPRQERLRVRDPWSPGRVWRGRGGRRRPEVTQTHVCLFWFTRPLSDK